MRYYVAVAEALNFRAAAEALHVSTPALSKQIKDLESEIGVKLLDRDTTQVRLTNAGTVFLEEAKLVLEKARDAVRQAHEADKGRRGRLTIGNVGAITASYMASTLTVFATQYPEVELELVDVDIPAQLDALESGLIELGFLPHLELPHISPEFETAPVLLEPLAVVMSEGHRLAGQNAVTLKDLLSERVLCAAGLSKPAPHTRYIQALFTARSLNLPRFVEVRGFESLMAMVAAGQGVALLAGRRMMRVENIQERPLKETGPDIQVDLRAVWRKGARGMLARNFVEVFRSQAFPRRSVARRVEKSA